MEFWNSKEEFDTLNNLIKNEKEKSKEKSKGINEQFTQKFQSADRIENLNNIKQIVNDTIEIAAAASKKDTEIVHENFTALKASIKDNLLAQLIFLETVAPRYPKVQAHLKAELSKGFKSIIPKKKKAVHFINFLLGIIKSSDADAKVLTDQERKLVSELSIRIFHYLMHGYEKIFSEFETENKVQICNMMQGLKNEDLFQDPSKNNQLKAFLALDPQVYQSKALDGAFKKSGMMSFR